MTTDVTHEAQAGPPTIVGEGAFRYEVAQGWEQIPAGWTQRDVAGVAVDSRDRVYVLTRDEHPLLVFERDGTFIRSWGEGLFTPRTHGITIGPDDGVYCTDDGDHTVRKFTTDGHLLLTLGMSGTPCDNGYDRSLATTYERLGTITRGGEPFNRPTNLAVAPNGDLYISDGYGNARIHHFSADGRLLDSWGEPGTGPGEFNLPHGIWVDAESRVMVADRENDRIQVFSPKGEFLTEWTDVQRPTQIFIDREGLVYVSELWWMVGERSYSRRDVIAQDQPGRMSIFDPEGRLLARWGGPDRCAAGNFCAPHGLYVDSRGDLYVGEVTYTFAGSLGLVPEDCHTLQKFIRVR